MPVVTWPYRSIALALVVGVLSACGGGGGSSNEPAGPATITVDDAETITREVLDAGIGAGAFGAAVGGGDILSTDGGTERAQIQRVQPSVAIPADDYDCVESGTVRLSGSLANPDNLSVGDRMNATFHDCNDGDDILYDGGMRIDVTAFSGDFLGDSYRLGARVTLTNLRITGAGAATTGDGRFDLDLDLTTPSRSEVTIDGERLDLSSGSDAWVLRNFAVTVVEDATGVESRTEHSGVGTLEGSGFEGAVDFVTVVPLVATGEDHPASGEVLIHGADGATIRATVINADEIQLAIDVDGDSVVDDTLSMGWNMIAGGTLGSVLYCANCGP